MFPYEPPFTVDGIAAVTPFFVNVLTVRCCNGLVEIVLKIYHKKQHNHPVPTGVFRAKRQYMIVLLTLQILGTEAL
jgi:hypothetical protein